MGIKKQDRENEKRLAQAVKETEANRARRAKSDELQARWDADPNFPRSRKSQAWRDANPEPKTR